MELLKDMTHEDLEQIYASISQQLNALVQEQQQLNEVIERLVGNRAVIGTLIELKSYKEQLVAEKLDPNTKPTMTPQEYEEYLAKQKAKK